ncbi:MAG: glycosyltransferase, partial [Chloroflexi bacterium]|nr:glycosyltransferase [Chloroflexota bacterium]
LLSDSPAAVPELRIIGLSRPQREAMSEVLRRKGIERRIRLVPFLPEDAFQAQMAGASLVVFPSDFEGFGLPVIEAMRLGIPVVVGPDAAVLEISGGHATVMHEWTAPALGEAVHRALESGSRASVLAAASAHAATFTWAQTTRRTRAAVDSAIGHRMAQPG